MLQTAIELINREEIEGILKEIVKAEYEEVKEEGLLLCMECGDVDLYIAASHHEGLQEAINKNFETDECGDVIDRKLHQQLMDDLFEYFLELHKESGFFDFYSAGYYIVNGEKRESETDMLAPKGLFYAPFEDARTD